VSDPIEPFLIRVPDEVLADLREQMNRVADIARLAK